MTSAPRLLVIVANGITGDSRVQRTAIAAARAGWDVTLLGAGGRGRRVESMMGAVRMIRLPMTTTYAAHSRGPRVLPLLLQSHRHTRESVRAAHQAWLRQATARIGTLRTGGRGPSVAVRLPLSKALGAVVRSRRVMHRMRMKAFRWQERQAGKPTGDWRRDCPSLVDLDLVFGPVIEELKPDLIHANDITMIHTAALSAARMRGRGEKVAWLYDAHEYVPGVESWQPAARRAYREIERRFIRHADAVVAVSPEIAGLLSRDYHLRETPLVVRDAPIRDTIGAADPSPSVRATCDLPDDVPLLVCAHGHDLGVAVAALTELTGVHLAVIAGDGTAVLAQAGQLEVADRVHVIPYAPQQAVPDYLSTADLGLICSRRSEAELADYLHARLPVVVGDVPTPAEFVRTHDVGEVSAANDPAAFAAAVRSALARRAELAAHITEPLLAEMSWEHQAAGLTELYRRIAPRAPEAPRPDLPWTAGEDTRRAGAAQVAKLPRRWRPLDAASRVRLGLGVANYAGQLAAFAQAICRDHADVTAEVSMRQHSGSFTFPADVYLDVDQQGELTTQVAQMQRILGRYTHLIADAFLPVFGLLNGNTIEGDLPALRRAGIRVALLAHGSELRHPARHLRIHKFSLFHDVPEGRMRQFTANADRNKRIAESSGLPLFVTTPDLLDDLPTATWAPLVVDVDAWASDVPVMERPRPKVLHGPSQRWTKGTDRILPTLNRLHDKGAIELVLAERVSWDEIREMVKSCDIVVDQFAVGSYGTLAVEAMAAGRPVVGYLDERVHAAAGVQPPIVNATPDTLGAALESLLDDPSRTAKIGFESAAYARDTHDGRRTAQAFAGFLES
ncbi:glycosyltransferase [Actinoplanes sp. NPDC089786]|uniref:glycosyltransferase n=1 Tax=Actinoplanes sp. NPDC089786 TaxID=3155185 RepID=UPI003430BDF7